MGILWTALSRQTLVPTRDVFVPFSLQTEINKGFDRFFPSDKIQRVLWKNQTVAARDAKMGHNGKSPPELAGVNTSGTNWIKFSQKKQH